MKKKLELVQPVEGVEIVDDDLSIPGYEIVHRHIKLAASDLELCYNLGRLLDQRARTIESLIKAVRENAIKH